MIFTPYPDENDIINRIQKYRNEEYALLRMTFTMIDKNNLDANGILRDLLDQWDLVNYDYLKHPSTLWAKAESRQHGDMVQFRYREIEFSRAPKFAMFLSLIKSGIITYDWRGYTTREGRYGGKNHGNAWRIKPYAKSELFGEIETIDL